MNIWIATALVLFMRFYNLGAPVFKSTFGFKSVFQWLMVLVYIWGLLYQRAYLKGQKIPIVQIVLVRMTEVLVHTFILKSNAINWPFMFVAFVLDLLYVVLLMIDKSKYKYIEEEID